MKNTNLRVVLIAFLAALLMGGCGKEPVKLESGKWSNALRAPDAKLRKKAAFKLGNIGRSDPTILPALIDALNDADAGVRSETILSLVKIGPEAKTAVPELTEVQEHDADETVRKYAAEALEKLR